MCRQTKWGRRCQRLTNLTSRYSTSQTELLLPCEILISQLADIVKENIADLEDNDGVKLWVEHS